MFKKRVLRSGQCVSPSALKALSVGDVWSGAGWGEQLLSCWTGALSVPWCGFSVLHCYFTVIKVKCVFVEEWLESDFPLSKAPFSCWAIPVALRGGLWRSLWKSSAHLGSSSWRQSWRRKLPAFLLLGNSLPPVESHLILIAFYTLTSLITVTDVLVLL